MKIKIISDSTGDLSPELIEKYDIAGFPTFALFKNGKLVDTKSGKMDEKVLKQFIKS